MSNTTQIELGAELLAPLPLDVSEGTPGPMSFEKGGN